MITKIQHIKIEDNNDYYIKREDQFGGSFGGNKVRKCVKFAKHIYELNKNCVISYGSIFSNHCRAVAEMCHQYGWKCILIVEKTHKTSDNFNLKLLELLNVEIVFVENKGTNVADCFNQTIEKAEKDGFDPYFIPGGGHNILGLQAYMDVFSEILKQEKQMKIKFDYIFCCFGTGTTYTGLLAGKIKKKSDHKIIGISNARNKKKCVNVADDLLNEIFGEKNCVKQQLYSHVNITDKYVGKGYGISSNEVKEEVNKFYKDNAILFDQVYMGKVLYGMKKYIASHKIKNSKILLVHTGALPVAFENMYSSEF